MFWDSMKGCTTRLTSGAQLEIPNSNVVAGAPRANNAPSIYFDIKWR